MSDVVKNHSKKRRVPRPAMKAKKIKSLPAEDHQTTQGFVDKIDYGLQKILANARTTTDLTNLKVNLALDELEEFCEEKLESLSGGAFSARSRFDRVRDEFRALQKTLDEDIQKIAQRVGKIYQHTTEELSHLSEPAHN